jgi:hypothetical protein
MSSSDDSVINRRHELLAQIARQRGELANAYRDLAKPIRYTETGLRSLAFIRSNPWIFSVVPAAFTVVSSLVSLARGKPSPPRRAARLAEEEERAARKVPRSIAGHVAKWGGRGWKLFKLYRKLRKFV